MRITPLEIKKQEFHKAFRGYDSGEVEAFLEMVAGEMESLNQENCELKDKLKALESKMEDYEETKETLHKALVTTEKAADERIGNAQKEAELILNDAQLKGEKIIEEARGKVLKYEQDITDLNRLRTSLIVRLRSLLSAQEEMLGAIEEEGKKERRPVLEEPITEARPSETGP